MDEKESNTKTVFILGAGASYDGGTPLMSNFLDVAHHLFRTDQAGKADEHFQRVFEARSKLQAVFSKANLDLNNVEDVFAAFEMGELLDSLPGFKDSEQIRELIDSLVVVIVKTIGITHKYGLASSFQGPLGGKVFSPPDPYGEFAKLIRKLRTEAVPRHDISVITYNYDVGCDFALHWSHQKYSYYLHDIQPQIDTVDLLKLHGSLNWGFDSDRQISVCQITDFLRKYELEQHHTGERDIWIFDIGMRLGGCEQFDSSDSFVRPFIVPPTWSKTTRYDAIRCVWKKAAQVLREADNIFVSGYSFPPSDAFFRFLYAIGSISEKFINRFWVYDIQNKEGELDHRYQGLLGPSVSSKYDYYKLPFKEAIKHLEDEFFGKPTAWGLRSRP